MILMFIGIVSPVIRKDICRSVSLVTVEDAISRHTTGKSGIC